MQYTHHVILSEPFCGEAIWGAQSKRHAKRLAVELRAKGCTVVRIEKAPPEIFTMNVIFNGDPSKGGKPTRLEYLTTKE
jgi:hypothetical protein